MRVIIEQYDEKLHGYCDDCDYRVVLEADSDNPEMWEICMAEDIIWKMGYSNGMFRQYDYGNKIEYFLCHA